MIYKTKSKYYKLYPNNYKVKDIGNQIQVGKYRFFVNKDFEITEKSTGCFISPTPRLYNRIINKKATLEDIEKYLEYIYVFIDIEINNKCINLNDAREILENDYYNLYCHKN